MATNQTRPTASSVSKFIAAIEHDTRRSDAKALVSLMKRASGEPPRMWGPSIIGFGSVHYRYDSGREGDTVLIGFAPRKAACVLYSVTGFKGADALLARLGKHTTGKGCLYIRSLADVDAGVLEQLLTRAVASRRTPQAPK